MNAPAAIAPDDILTFLGTIPEPEYERRRRLRGYRNAASAYVHKTECDTSRLLAWQVIEWATPNLYELSCDYLSGLSGEQIIVPANEVIHDRFNCLYHPLVGIPPIFACGLAASHGLSIQNSQLRLFRNAAQPGGLLVAPDKIDQANADRLKQFWQANFTGDNVGQVAAIVPTSWNCRPKLMRLAR